MEFTVAQLQRIIKNAEKAISKIQKKCKHKWEKTEDLVNKDSFEVKCKKCRLIKSVPRTKMCPMCLGQMRQNGATYEDLMNSSEKTDYKCANCGHPHTHCESM